MTSGVTTTAVGASRVGAMVEVGCGTTAVLASEVAGGGPDVTINGWVAVGGALAVGEEQAASRSTAAVRTVLIRIMGTSKVEIRIFRAGRIPVHKVGYGD